MGIIQECMLAAQKANCILISTKRGGQPGEGKGIVPLYSACVREAPSAVRAWGPQNKKGLELLEQVEEGQRRATKMIRG